MKKIETIIDKWLTQPEPNAAGRLGLYRIIFAVMYFLLTSTSASSFAAMSLTPSNAWYPTPILIWMARPPSAEILTALSIINTAALVLLAIGWKVRWTTLVLLISGICIGALNISVGAHVDHSKVFNHVNIPLLMLFAPWGETFSLDAVLRRRRGETSPDPTDDSLRYSWVIKALLWLLALLFMFGGLVKAFPPGQWLTDLDLMRKLMLDHNRNAQDYTRYVLASLPLFPLMIQMMGLVFESFYPLVLVNRTWRRFYLACSAFFHMGTIITINFGFTTYLFFYPFFFDLYSVYQRFFPHWILRPFATVLGKLPSWGLILLTWGITIFVTYARNDSMMWGIVGSTILAFLYKYIWVITGIVATYGLLTAVYKLYQNLRQRRLFALDG